MKLTSAKDRDRCRRFNRTARILGLSGGRLAKKLHITRNYVSMIKNYRSSPSPPLLHFIEYLEWVSSKRHKRLKHLLKIEFGKISKRYRSEVSEMLHAILKIFVKHRMRSR